MKLKRKARRYLSLFSCYSNSKSHMTNYFNFKLSTDVEKNPGPTQNNTHSYETIIKLCDVHSVSKIPIIITIYGAHIEIKYSFSGENQITLTLLSY
ncbi:hypothetical protein P5673_025236 [Acropora cervicornis]|uniref:Uncharacterized protein n=1 Tax=Acropora cervicornis TaxID=6130 RepID=A0AAD9Q329_ACRCE|nr:hypothetical protein P5673_025236 [Acropora cervicornis]